MRAVSENSQAGMVHGIGLMIIFCQIALSKLRHSLHSADTANMPAG